MPSCGTSRLCKMRSSPTPSASPNLNLYLQTTVRWRISSPGTTHLPVFNYRLSRARRCVENAFGIQANSRGCLLTALRRGPQNVKTMVLAWVTLYNMLSTACADDGALCDRENEHHNRTPDSWRDDAVLDDLQESAVRQQHQQGEGRDRDCI